MGRVRTFGGNALRVAFATALFLFAFVPASPAAPSHPRLESLDINGLNHACGAAVDSKGDVYASSAGESKVKVFNEAHTEIGSISNSNEPCALAVDSTGHLYVSERATGKVIRYTPNAYPFSGTPTYGVPTTIDASGNARGIAIDPTDDSLYVAEGTRVTIYKSDGSLFTGNEVQALKFLGSPSGGSYTLEFEGQTTASIPYNATSAEIQSALEALSTIGAGSVTVKGEGANVTFGGALATTNLPQLVVDDSALVGSSAQIETKVNGFDGHLGEGEFTDATGVVAYTSPGAEISNQDRYVSVADAGAGEIKLFAGRMRFAVEYGTATFPGTLQPPQTIDGSETPEDELGLALTGAYLGVDRKNGHLYAYDATHKVLNEFEATGQYFTRLASPVFADAEATAIAVDRSGGANTGTLYPSAGAGAGAKLLAFGPVAAPSRPTLPEPPSEKFTAACGTAVDPAGDVYVAGESAIRVYPPEPQLKEGKPVPLATISDSGHPCDLAVDSKGILYAAERGKLSTGGDESVARLEPSAYPPVSGTTYSKSPTPVETIEQPRGIAVNLANDHLFVVHAGDATHKGVHEYDSAAHGSAELKSSFCGLVDNNLAGIDVNGANGDVYVVESKQITVCNSSGTVVARIDGSGSPGGVFSGLDGSRVAVDQSNGHVLVGEMESRGVAEEFEASGGFVAQFGSFSKVSGVPSDLAVDNSSGPTKGNLYVAYLNDLSAFGPLAYGEPPVAVTGTAGEIGGGEATLNGIVDPRGFDLTACRFEYLSDAQYIAGGKTFAGAQSEPCEEALAEIGKGAEAIAVHAGITGLDPEGRYRFRLIAKNNFGTGEGEPVLFGAPVITTKSAQPILYREATLRGKIDPSGLATEYHFEFGLEAGEYEQVTPTQTLSATSDSSDIEAFLTGLAEDTTYHFRLVAENDAATVEGPDRELRTLAPLPVLACPNATLRFENNSSHLPDCRAYELVTPADTRGVSPVSAVNEAGYFNNWFVTPRGPLAGESLTFLLAATLPGTEGNGQLDGFNATRGTEGWSSRLFGPSFAQNGNLAASFWDVSPDQLYSVWTLGSETPGALPRGIYLRTPTGFEVLGAGILGTDLASHPRYVSRGASHVIFESGAQLEAGAPASPLTAVYDRSPDGPTQVVSLLPGEATPTSSAKFKGATFDGSSVVFAIGGDLYLRRDGTETIKVTSPSTSPAAFAGLSDDGERVFYAKLNEPSNTQSYGTLYAFDADGAETTKIAEDAKFLAVSSDGSRAYYIAADQLFIWDGTSRLITTLDPMDLFQTGQVRFPGTEETEDVTLDSWTAACAVKDNPGELSGRAHCPVRATSDGRILVFQSHADLTPPYEGNGHSEIYRYDAEEESLLCVSCDPSGVPATAESDLESVGIGRPNHYATALVPGVSDDGSEVFFQTPAALLPEDANSVSDVYEWQAQGSGGCERPQGCLALISSGQGDEPSYVYSMSASGHDVFFSTTEKLVGSDVAGSPSIYDARVEGGFPAEVEKEPCHGDACQGEGSQAPELPSVNTGAPGSGNVEETPAPRPCAKGKRRVKGRCVAVHKHHRGRHRRSRGSRRRAGR